MKKNHWFWLATNICIDIESGIEMGFQVVGLFYRILADIHLNKRFSQLDTSISEKL